MTRRRKRSRPTRCCPSPASTRSARSRPSPRTPRRAAHSAADRRAPQSPLPGATQRKSRAARPAAECHARRAATGLVHLSTKSPFRREVEALTPMPKRLPMPQLMRLIVASPMHDLNRHTHTHTQRSTAHKYRRSMIPTNCSQIWPSNRGHGAGARTSGIAKGAPRRTG